MASGLVHIIDDDEPIRRSLESLLRSVKLATKLYDRPSQFDMDSTWSGPACLLVDVRMPGMSGLELQRNLADAGVRAPMILMSGHGDIPMSVRAMKAGAIDFLTKPFREQEVLDAVNTALERDRLRLEQHAADAALRDRYETLSMREREVMAQVTAGLMNKQAAFALGLSEITIKIHRGTAMRKMGARSFAEWVRMAQALDLPAEPEALRTA